MTNQPASGRARGGGLRMGEMEKDTILAHGCVELLKRKFYDECDPDTIEHCAKCGALDGQFHAGCACDTQPLELASATKLLIRELRAMHINVRYATEEPPSPRRSGSPVYRPASPPQSPVYRPASPTPMERSDSPVYRPVSP